MTYQLETTDQLYGDRAYLAHNLVGNTPQENRYFFGQRVPSYGIINFGAIGAGQTKDFKPIDNGINSDIMLTSIFDFTTLATNDECTFKLFSGTTEILEQKIRNDEMPYTFPPGAIINPNLTIQVEPRYPTTQLLIYWQPVHTIYYREIT